MGAFVPRTGYPKLTSLPRSYFLGHHRSGLTKMKTMLSTVDLIIECRDYRVPITSRNPMFEESLAGRERVIVYTKRDLGSNGASEDRLRENALRRYHKNHSVLFSDHKSPRSVRQVLAFAREFVESSNSLTGSRMLVVGMPNVGKSTLLNALRLHGVGKGKAAHTGAQPGVTRKIATGVKIIEGTESREGLYLLDTPGVFVTYVPDSETMLKLALCGSVKDTIIAPATLADYLLYHLNLHDPGLYAEYCEPTNDIMKLLEAVGVKTGRLQKGATPDVDASALWIIQRWRQGNLGRFALDEVSEEALERSANEEVGISINQAKKVQKNHRREMTKSRLSQNKIA